MDLKSSELKWFSKNFCIKLKLIRSRKSYNWFQTKQKIKWKSTFDGWFSIDYENCILIWFEISDFLWWYFYYIILYYFQNYSEWHVFSVYRFKYIARYIVQMNENITMPDINYLRIQIWYHDVPHKIVEKITWKKTVLFWARHKRRKKKLEKVKIQNMILV